MTLRNKKCAGGEKEKNCKKRLHNFPKSLIVTTLQQTRQTAQKETQMDKGIRPAARAKFVELNEKRRRNEAPYTGPKANTIFRKEVMSYLMSEFAISLASAATHYNEAFKLVKEATPELVSGLGRPEDKKGGRKAKVMQDDGTVKTVDAVPGDIPEEPKVVLFTVSSKKGMVATDLTEADADALIAKAEAAKKGTLTKAAQE